MKCSKILAPIAIASIFAASSFAATEEVLATYGAITIKKVTVKQKEHVTHGDLVDVEKTVAVIDDDSKVTPVIKNDVTVDSIFFNRKFKRGVASTVMLPFDVPDANAVWRSKANIFTFVKVEKACEQYCDFRAFYETNSGHMYKNTPYVLVANEDDYQLAFGQEYENAPKFVLNTESFTPNPGDPSTPAVYEYGMTRTSNHGYNYSFTGTYKSIKFTNPAGIYGFAGVEKADAHIGDFKKAACKDDQCASVRPFRAYLKITEGSLNKSATAEELPETIGVYLIGEDKGTTYIGQMNTYTGEIVKEDNRWFDMKGRVLDHKPTTKGTYYNNKKKVIIK